MTPKLNEELRLVCFNTSTQHSLFTSIVVPDKHSFRQGLSLSARTNSGVVSDGAYRPKSQDPHRFPQVALPRNYRRPGSQWMDDEVS